MSPDLDNQPETSDPDVEVGAGRYAPADEALAERLSAPSTPTAIYLGEASVYRPVATGDIFQDVPVPGATEDEMSYGLTMLIAHPSAMRKGAVLETRARAAPVAPVDGLSKKKWAGMYYDVYPLPRLRAIAAANGFDIEDHGWAALLGLAAPIQTAQLDVTKRVACLSPDGIHLLLQRIVHTDTRAPIRTDTLANVFKPKLHEIEMLETWNEELVPARVDSGSELGQALAVAAEEFDVAMNRAGGDGMSARGLLEADQPGQAERRIAAELRRRTEQEQGEPAGGATM